MLKEIITMKKDFRAKNIITIKKINNNKRVNSKVKLNNSEHFCISWKSKMKQNFKKYLGKKGQINYNQRFISN